MSQLFFRFTRKVFWKEILHQLQKSHDSEFYTKKLVQKLRCLKRLYKRPLTTKLMLKVDYLLLRKNTKTLLRV